MVSRLVVAASLLCLLIAAAAAGPADRYIERGDRYFGNRGKARKWCVKAIEQYEKALAVDAKSVEASWRIARASYWLGMHTEGDDEKLAVYKKGIDVARRAVALEPKSVASHFWLGVSFGKYGETKGVMNSLALVEPIRKEMETVLELDERFEAGGAHRVLGRLYHKLPGIAGGDPKKAIEHLKKAIAIDGSRLLNHLFIAEVYLAADDEANARKHLQLVIDGAYEESRRAENEEEKAEAKRLLEELEA
jgi:tetratricopeptide (TPR) repeat protein